MGKKLFKITYLKAEENKSIFNKNKNRNVLRNIICSRYAGLIPRSLKARCVIDASGADWVESETQEVYWLKRFVMFARMADANGMQNFKSLLIESQFINVLRLQ